MDVQTHLAKELANPGGEMVMARGYILKAASDILGEAGTPDELKKHEQIAFDLISLAHRLRDPKDVGPPR